MLSINFVFNIQALKIVHKNVTCEKVLFYYNLQLLYLSYLYKVKSCQVVAKNRPFYKLLAKFKRVSRVLLCF